MRSLAAIALLTLFASPSIHAGPLTLWEPPPEFEMRAETDAAEAAGYFRPLPFDNAAPTDLVLAVLADNGFVAAPHAVSSYYDMGGIAPGELVMIVQLRGQEHEIPGIQGQRLLGFIYENTGRWHLALDTAAMSYGIKRGKIAMIYENGLKEYEWTNGRFAPVFDH